MSDELINNRSRQSRQRPSGISFDNESAQNTRGDEYSGNRRTASNPVRKGGSAHNTSPQRQTIRKDAFDLSYGEDETEEKLRKTPKETNSSRPVVISAMVLAAVMLTVIIYAVTSRNSRENSADSTYKQPKTIELGGEKIDTATFNIEISDSKKITDIDDLRYCFLLKTLTLSNDGISDISALSSCSLLETLNLSQNNISNIKPLAKLTAITDLNLSLNSIDDLSPLEEMTKMEHLDISYNYVLKIDVVANMTSLRQLNAASNGNDDERISDITPLANLKELNTLDLSSNSIFDISPLSELTNLSMLHLAGNNISSLTSLRDMTALDTLDLSDNVNITDIEPLMELTNLSTLDLTGTDVSKEDIAKLKEALPNCTIIS